MHVFLRIVLKSLFAHKQASRKNTTLLFNNMFSFFSRLEKEARRRKGVLTNKEGQQIFTTVPTTAVEQQQQGTRLSSTFIYFSVLIGSSQIYTFVVFSATRPHCWGHIPSPQSHGSRHRAHFFLSRHHSSSLTTHFRAKSLQNFVISAKSKPNSKIVYEF